MPSIVGDIEMIPPEFTVRVIMLYGRPNCPLVFKTKEVTNELGNLNLAPAV
ncbi:hypothetical protein DPMN_084457 [Dreissena polymorpha]|uniref:Uncharacterized protein n=1 Tax=Dreissena polymorpha TaxID=45954 RepID=A0A9D3YAK4_DREPO|nr:hypothetical protein DPMN_084457 [Dreissena polymorpha]